MRKIGKYEVLEKIGVGGFGEVFKAFDPFIKRHVAVKTCNSDDQETRNRFFQEAAIAGNLHHRNVTTIYDFGIEDGLPYLIQEYLSGEDLDRKIKRKDFLPYPEKLYYLLQIARGLAYAHQKGVIHRDIKPANIRILEDGTAKIMDFGIAKLAQQETGLTKTGMTVGTAAYLAPEQIRGEPVDHRTDVFSFGVMTYEVLTYVRPFQGEQISAVIYQILNREPKPLREVWPSAPPEADELIRRCLAKDPQQRFADGGETLRHLESLQQRRRGERPSEEAGRVPAGRDTRQIAPGPAAPGPAAPPSAAPPPAVPAQRRGIDDLELTSVSVDDSSRSRTTTVRGTQGGRSFVKYGLLLLLPVLALAAGWWFGDPERRRALLGPPAEESPPVENAADVEPAPGESPPPPATAAPPPPTVAPPETPAPPPVTVEPPPPSEPSPGILVVKKAPWTDSINLRLGSRAYPLTRNRSLTLKPGNYKITFELLEPGYEDSKTLEVTVREGETRQIDVPILQPGALSVRAGLGKLQGRIAIGDGEWEPSPLTRRKMPPGRYELRIESPSGEGESIRQPLEIQPGQETILTFDLGTGAVSEKVKPLE